MLNIASIRAGQKPRPVPLQAEGSGCAMAIRTFGPNAVDWEQRIDLDRLRNERQARLREELERSDLGALLTFDFSNIRYMTSTHIGTWAMDKLIRFALLPRGGEPVIWDFGSAAKHHQLYNPWLDGAKRARAGVSTLRGAFNPDAGIADDVATKVYAELAEYGLTGDPVGVDIIEMPVLQALSARGLQVVDGQQVFLAARTIKTPDEISLLTQACSMVDAAYDKLYEFLRPGVRENECVGLVAKTLYDLGSASRGMRDAYVRCREYMDRAIELVRPGATTADIVSVWPRAEEFGFPDEQAAFALQYGHGVGLSIWEKPIFSRLVSLEHPETLREGMVFALETYWPAVDGWSAARIEEELVVTATGCEVITKFPAEDLLVAGQRYFTVNGPLTTTRDAQSHLNTTAGTAARLSS